MLNRFYFLQEDIPDGGFSSDSGIVVAHLVDGRPGQTTRLLAHLYSEAGNYPFCLAFRGKERTEALVREALLLFFHPSYVVAERGRPVFVDSDDVGQLFREQRIEVELMSPGAVKTLQSNGHDPAGDYCRYCLSSYEPEDVFLLTGGKLADWQAALDQVDVELKGSHERFYHLAMDRRATGELAAKQDRELRRLREERQIMQELLELNSKHDEVNYILKFYRNEYEILPLWYKRFGHVIKVIQGKRSFRSLFDKGVKKYKD